MKLEVAHSEWFDLRLILRSTQPHRMLESDEYWRETLEDAAVQLSPSKPRMLLAIMLHCCNPSDPFALWEEFKHLLAEDKLNHYRPRLGYTVCRLTPMMKSMTKLLTILKTKCILLVPIFTWL